MATNPLLRQRLLKAAGQNVNQMGRAALADSAPAPLLRLLGGNGNVNFTTQDSTPGAVAGFSGKAAPNAYAGVNQGNPNTVQVMDQAAFQKPGQTGQLAVHEATHIMQNNLPPKVAAKIPADNASDPYNFGGEAGLVNMRKQGKTLLDLPREQQAAVMQYYTAQNDGYQNKLAAGTAGPADHAAAQQRQQVYGPWVNDLNHVPQSVIMPTDPQAKGNTINTQVRPLPGPATDIPGMTNYAKQVYQYGDLPPGFNVTSVPNYSDVPDGFKVQDPNAPPPVNSSAPIPTELQGPAKKLGLLDARDEDSLSARLANAARAASAGIAGLAHPIQQIKTSGIGMLAGGMTPYGAPINAFTGDKQADALNQGAQAAARATSGEQGIDMALHPAYTAGMIAGPLIAGKALGVAPKALGVAGDALQSGGAGVMNSYLKAGKKAFKYDHDPGMGVLQEGPATSFSLSRQGLADKLAAKANSAGAAVPDTVRENAGTMVPRSTVAGNVDSVIAGKKKVALGPGGDANAANRLQEFGDTFRSEHIPSSQNVDLSGSMSVPDLYAIRSNVDDNINWNRDLDPTEATVNNARREIRSNLADTLYQAAPDLKAPSQRYGNLVTASKLATDRTMYTNGSRFSPTKLVTSALGGAVPGVLSHHPDLGIGGAAVAAFPELLKAPSFSTGLATGLFQAGRGVSALGRGAGRVSSMFKPENAVGNPASGAEDYQNPGKYDGNSPNGRAQVLNQLFHLPSPSAEFYKQGSQPIDVIAPPDPLKLGYAGNAGVRVSPPPGIKGLLPAPTSAPRASSPLSGSGKPLAEHSVGAQQLAEVARKLLKKR